MNHMGTKQLETERLILRKFKIEDAEDMFKHWGNDSAVNKYLSWNIHQSVQDSQDIIDLWVSKYEDMETYNWAIVLKEIDEVIGSISMVKLENKHYSCEIGYCIGSKFWNNGITTEAFQAVIEYLLNEVGFNRVVAMYDTENKASGKVMKKCKMTYEGTLRDAHKRNDEFYSLGVYSILKKEYRSSK